ncbi:MAG TPA: hypothetical protein VMF56_14420 [Acidobacteriaceae bacterium]|nr:hypothetical protein [Acidobacteriaceae bacterium]
MKNVGQSVIGSDAIDVENPLGAKATAAGSSNVLDLLGRDDSNKT